MGSTIRNFFIGILFLFVILALGTYYFRFFEGVSLIDAYYYVFLTVTTVGAPIGPASQTGKIIATIMIFFGMGVFLYIASMFAKILIEGQTSLFISHIRGGIIRMKKEKNHIIICGYGMLGQYVSEVLEQEKKKFVIIEKDPDKVSKLLKKHKSIIEGDALDPKILKTANIDKAKTIIATLNSDPDNMYLIMTAQDINPHILLAARARDEDAVKRLHKVGAQIVVLPEVVGGKQLANAVLEVNKSERLSTIRKKSG